MTTMFEAGSVPQWTTGDRLARALRHSDTSTNEMAVYLDVSRNTVTNYTHDKTRVSGATLKLWALKTGVPLQWLETGVTSDDGDGNDGRALPSGGPEPTQENVRPRLLVAA